MSTSSDGVGTLTRETLPIMCLPFPYQTTLVIGVKRS